MSVNLVPQSATGMFRLTVPYGQGRPTIMSTPWVVSQNQYIALPKPRFPRKGCGPGYVRQRLVRLVLSLSWEI
jgi:hypothetical protein